MEALPKVFVHRRDAIKILLSVRWHRNQPIENINFATIVDTFLRQKIFYCDAQCKIVSIRARKTLFFVISDRFNVDIHLVDRQT